MKALTITDLRKELKIAFKENNKFIFDKVDKTFKKNNKILFKRIDEIVNARTTEMSTAIVRTVDEIHEETNQKIDNVSSEVKDLKQDVKFMHQDIKDLNTDFSDKPSRRQFEEFKSKFDNYITA